MTSTEIPWPIAVAEPNKGEKGTPLDIIDGGARARYRAFTPNTAEAAGPVPLIPLDITEIDEEA